MYWLPITWQEQTLASILSNLLGLPIAFVIGVGSGAIVFAAFYGLILQGLLAFVAMVGSCFSCQRHNRNSKASANAFYWSSLQIERQSSNLGKTCRYIVFLHHILRTLFLCNIRVWIDYFFHLTVKFPKYCVVCTICLGSSRVSKLVYCAILASWTLRCVLSFVHCSILPTWQYS